jgi:hypothetical protein
MNKMLLVTALAAFAAGCANTKFITARTVVNGDVLYTAYTEWNQQFFSSTTDAKLLRCNRGDNNALTCQSEEQVNKYLNEGSWFASDSVK